VRTSQELLRREAGDPVHTPGPEVREIQLPVLVLTKRGDQRTGILQQGSGPTPSANKPRAPDPSTAEVSEQVSAPELRYGGAPVDISPDDGASQVVTILDDGKLQRATPTTSRRVEAVSALHPAPAIVLTTSTGGPLEIDLLERILPDISNEQVSGRSVKTEAPRVAQSIRPYFGTGPGSTDKRVTGRDPVGQSAIHIYPQYLPEKRVQSLRAVPRIAPRSAVAQADVEEAIGPELQLAAVMVGERLRLPQDDSPRSGVRYVGVGRNVVTGNHRIALEVGVIDVEETIRFVFGMESQTEQTLFTDAGANKGLDVEKGRREHLHAVKNADLPALQGDEKTATVVASVGDANGVGQTGGNGLKLESCQSRRDTERGECHTQEPQPQLSVSHQHVSR
jgi:hypothetical protein